MVNFKEDEQLNTLNHSCAHLMAQAIKHLYPQAKFWVGPVVAEGFYYDIDLGDDVIRDEWARIPHFYNAFYVYKYATGYSAATAISKKILTEGKPAAQDYIRFLKTGESDHPIELLKIAGEDMSSPLPVQQAMETFNQLLDEFESLL